MRIIYLMLFSVLVNMGFGQQGEFKVEVSNDTVLAGNNIIVKYEIVNTNGDFVAPEFNDFDIVSGPVFSSVLKIVNGETTQKSSYSYYLEPKNEGELYIEPAYLYTEGDTLETAPSKIIVLPNPEGVKVEPEMKDEQKEFSFPRFIDKSFEQKKRKEQEKKKKKKLKTRRL